MNNSVTITIRNVETSDISVFFEQQLDPEGWFLPQLSERDCLSQSARPEKAGSHEDGKTPR
jgi:hypothetical protein